MLKTIKKLAGKAIAQRWQNVCLAFFVAASLATACSDKDDDTLPIDTAQSNENVQSSETAQSVEQQSQPSEQPSQPEKAVRTLSVSIPATINDDGSLSKAVSIDGTTCTGRFVAYENVYVYDVSEGAIIEGSLNPSNISDDGKSCTLVGTLTTNGDITGHEISLLYNALGTYFKFDYTQQNGLPANVCDGGIATGVIVKSTELNTLTTEEPANFVLQQSVFRFQFVDEANNPISVKSLSIKSVNGVLPRFYYPLRNEEGSQYYVGDGILSFKIDKSIADDYIYVALCLRETNGESDGLSFTVGDENFEYEGTKSAPSGGFKNGKFYYNTDPIKLQKKPMLKPTIIWTTAQETEPNSGFYMVYSPNYVDPYAITISGTSVGYRFLSVMSSGTVTLDKLDATFDGTGWFLQTANNYNLTVELVGDNVIKCKNSNLAINVSGELKLTGNGTLTVTTNSKIDKGIRGTNYTSETEPANNGDPGALAADENHTVTISETDNGDGTYSWTYTVKPKSK